MKLIIVPDEHGRGLWKRGLKYFNENPDSKMIFLGDYLDPYFYYENVTHEDAYENFKEILGFANKNKDRVIMLIGNHDEFYRDYNKQCCRHNKENYELIAKLFTENEKLFRYAYKQDNYLFTHAGVCSGWLEYNDLDLDENNIIDYLNEGPKTLWQVGASRGGRYNAWGSPLWCCWLGDWYYDDCQNPFNLKQIFGHTRLEEGMYEFDKNKNIYMMDTRNCFLLDTETEKINLLS